MPKPRKNAAQIHRQEMEALLAPAVATLRRLARYKLEPPMQRRMLELGERKEFLGKKEHNELLALVEFSQRRTIDTLEAKLALKRLQEVFPNLVRGK